MPKHDDETLCMADLDRRIESLIGEAENVIRSGQLGKDRNADFLLFMNITLAMRHMHQMTHMLGAGMNAALTELETDVRNIKFGIRPTIGSTVQ